MSNVIDRFALVGFATRDTGAVRYGKNGRRVVFVHERDNGKVVLSTQSNCGTSRRVFKSVEGAIAALVSDDVADKKASW